MNRALFVLLASAALCAPSTPLLANNPGDLLGSATFDDQSWTGVTTVTDGSIWTVDEMDGKVYHINTALELVPGDTRTHPIGPAAGFPTLKPVCRGLAYIAAQNALVVLNSSDNRIALMNAANGSPIGGTIDLAAPANARLAGLTYDADANLLWAVDDENDGLLGFNPATGALVRTLDFPGDTPPETYLYGTGVAHADQRLHLLWGDIFQQRAGTVYLLDPQTGAADPLEINLDAVGAGETRSIATVPGALAVLLQRDSSSIIALVDREPPSVPPPSAFLCTPHEDSHVSLIWQNNGPGAGGAYSEISVVRNGTAIAQLPGTATAYDDNAAPAGTLTYEVRPRQGIDLVLPARRRIVNGRGAILKSAPFVGGIVSGIAVDPDTGDVWVTDSKPVSNGVYRIWRMTPDLAVIGSIEVPMPGAPYGITFWPDAPVGDQRETIILVTDETTNLVQKFKKDGTASGGATPLRLPEEDGAPEPKAGSIAFDPRNGSQFLTVLDTALNRIVWVDRFGAVYSGPSETIRTTCTPPGTSGIVPEWGLDCSTQSGLMHVGIENGSIHEIDSFCNVTAFDLNAHLPEGPRSIKVKDFAYSANVVYVTSPATNTIFRILAYPVGQPFIRGNANDDASVNVADAVFILQYLFEVGAAPACPDAADVNDDGKIDISDPVYLLFYLFGGPLPPEPHPGEGLDPTLEDDLSC